MRIHIVALCLVFAAVWGECLGAPEAARDSDANPMASFARMVSGEWRLGTMQVDTWRWGPGERSVRMHTVGDGGGNPWRELVVYYWRPDQNQVRLLGFHPDIPGIGRGVAGGTIEFDGQTAVAAIELYQPGRLRPNRRTLGVRWTFDGPDAYHEELLEDSGAGLEPLAEWDLTRSIERTDAPRVEVGEAPKPSENLRAFEGLLGRWKAQAAWAGAGAVELETTFEWLEYLDVVSVRIVAREPGGEPSHVLDAYLYHHVGTGSLHCLALSKSGGVYEGCVAELEGGGLQIELQGFEEGHQSAPLAQFDLEQGGGLRGRVWLLEGEGRRLLLDAALTKVLGDQN